MILNLTQHAATPEQVGSGVVDLPEPELRATVAELLTFEQPPRHQEIMGRAADLAELAVAKAERDLAKALEGAE